MKLKAIDKTNDMKGQLFENINKIYKTLVRLTKKRELPVSEMKASISLQTLYPKDQ